MLTSPQRRRRPHRRGCRAHLPRCRGAARSASTSSAPSRLGDALQPSQAAAVVLACGGDGEGGDITLGAAQRRLAQAVKIQR